MKRETLLKDQKKIIYGFLTLLVVVAVGIAIIFGGHKEKTDAANSAPTSTPPSVTATEVKAEAKAETKTPEQIEKDTKKAYFDKYIGDWYGKLAYGQALDGSTAYASAHIHVKGIEINDNNQTIRLLGSIYYGPVTSKDEDFNTENALKGKWDASNKRFYLGESSNVDLYFALSNANTDAATFETYNFNYGAMNPYKIEMKKMNAEDIQKEKDKYQKWHDGLKSNNSSSNKIPQYIKGSWSGVIKYNGDYMGFKFNFTKVDDGTAEGKLTQVENKGRDPDFGYGVDYRFTATLDAKTNSLIIKWSDGQFKFSMAGESSAIYHSQYGDIPLSKK